VEDVICDLRKVVLFEVVFQVGCGFKRFWLVSGLVKFLGVEYVRSSRVVVELLG